jgi:hypothetical protein
MVFHTKLRSERLCVKIVSIRLKRDLIGYAPFLLSALVKRSQTTLHTASIQLEAATSTAIGAATPLAQTNSHYREEYES